MRLFTAQRAIKPYFTNYSVLQCQVRKAQRFDLYPYLDLDLMDFLDLTRWHAEKSEEEPGTGVKAAYIPL